jgi:PAS domain S-box-containing protein
MNESNVLPGGGPELITASQWRQIVKSATDTAIISTDPNGRVTSWSQGAQRILGWSEAEMLGESLERLFTEEDCARCQLAQEVADARARGRGGGDEGWRARKDGSRFWAAGEITPIHDGPRGVVGFIKILRDRTLRWLSEEAVREERRALEVLNRASSALSLETDVQHLVQFVTDSGVELTGAEFGAFFYNVPDQAGGSYTLYTPSGAPLGAFSKFPMPRNTGVVAPTFIGEGIVRSDDITQDPRYGRHPPHHGMPKGHLPVRSYLAVPVISRSGEVIGGLLFGHAKSGIFTERSERGLLGLAAEAAVAIDNGRLSQAAQHDRKRAGAALRDLNATLEQQVVERTEQLHKTEQALRQSQKMEALGQLTCSRPSPATSKSCSVIFPRNPRVCSRRRCTR